MEEEPSIYGIRGLTSVYVGLEGGEGRLGWVGGSGKILAR